MSGLFRRFSSRRSAGPDGVEPAAQAEPGTTDAHTGTPAEPGGHESLLADPAAPTRVLREGDTPAPHGEPAQPESAAATPQPESGPAAPQPAVGPRERPLGELAPVIPPAATPEPPVPVSDMPAGLDPDELLTAPPSSARRGRLRRRAAYLRAAREVLLRDLGGFAYEIHRTAGDVEHEAHRRLREIKLARLSRVDAELHALELRLDDVRRHVVVREPGIGGECPQCGELFGSDANYCAHCGVPLTEAARKAIAREAAAHPAHEPAPAPQSTEEFTSPAEAEFAWPRRESEAVATAGEPTAGDGGATPSDQAPTAVEQAAATGEETTPGGDTTGERAAPAGDEPAAGDAATPGDEAAGERAEGGDSAETRGEHAAGDEPDVTRAEAARTDEPSAGDAAAADESGDASAKDAPAGSDGLNGRDSAYRTVERRS